MTVKQTLTTAFNTALILGSFGFLGAIVAGAVGPAGKDVPHVSLVQQTQKGAAAALAP